VTIKEADVNLAYQEFEHGVNPRLKATGAVLVGFLGTIILAWILGGPLGNEMDDIHETRTYHLIPFIFSVSLFGILVYKAYIKNIRGLSFIGSAVLVYGIAELLLTIKDPIDDFDTSAFNRETNWAAIADLLVPVAVVLLYFHIELIEKLRPGLTHAIGIVGTALPLIIGGILIMIFDDVSRFDNLVEDIRNVTQIYLGLFALIVLWISLFGFRVMYATLKHADSPDTARGSQFVLIGFSSLLTIFVLLSVDYRSRLSEDRLILSGEEFFIHSVWLVTLALFFMIFAYLTNPEFAYSIPFDVYQLLVINAEQGITLYSFVNEVRETGSVAHAALKSPAIVAIQNLVQEIASAEGHIILIGMSDRILILKTYKQIVSVLIGEKNSFFINKGLEDFTKAFYQEYQPSIEKFTGNVSVFKDANKLVRKHLPFMRKESLVASGP
jgi:hypothetical protein